jgi:hypothetical protein
MFIWNSSKKKLQRASFPAKLEALLSAHSARESVTRSNGVCPTYYLYFVRANTAANNSPSALPNVLSFPLQILELKAIGTSTSLPWST